MKTTILLMTAAVLSAETLFAADTAYGKAMEKAHAVKTMTENRWYSDLAEAKAASAKSGKPLFILFTGSDWCPWCVKLEKEIINTAEFNAYAAKKLILFKADMLRDMEKEKADKINKQMRQYRVSGFPTVVLENSKGKVIGKTGYTEGGPSVFLKKLDSIIEKKQGFFPFFN